MDKDVTRKSKTRCVRISLGMTVLSMALTQINYAAPTDPVNKWEESIQQFEKWDEKNSVPKDSVLFLGSSSIRWWKTAQLFEEFPVINRGFGGAKIADINYYYRRIVRPYKPKVIVFYCGINDLFSGSMAPQQVYMDYHKFVGMVKKSLPETKVIFMSIKAGPAHWDKQSRSKIDQANQMIQEFSQKEENFFYLDVATGMLDEHGQPDPKDYQDDGIHLTYRADKKWAELLRPKLAEIYNQQ